jgi:unsaturated chondroitin disaccharide hydrolase
MIHIDRHRTPADLLDRVTRVWEVSGRCIDDIEHTWNPQQGAPVLTVQGRYRSLAWTEWTQGFQFGSMLLHFDGTGDERFLELGRERTIERMPCHLTHMGVHDHGFNTVSTYGNLWRMAREGRFTAGDWEKRLYELALRVSGAVQARRWTPLPDGGFVHSFNGPHSLFVDTLRSLRVLALAHQLGQHLSEEQDRRVDLCERLVQHALSTARWNVYYGEGRDAFDARGRVAHESLFNVANGSYRGPATQQGFSPYSTWTRGLAWAILGFAEVLEWLGTLPVSARLAGRASDDVIRTLRDAALATADFYVDSAPSDGIPYWDTGAPGLVHLPGWQERPADPFNDYEPVDSSAASIAAQGLLRLGEWLDERHEDGGRHVQAGLQIAARLFDASGPYLGGNGEHQGLILHSLYHRPAGWDHVPVGGRVPRGEASMWGDYHARELALWIQRRGEGAAAPKFFGPSKAGPTPRGDEKQ